MTAGTNQKVPAVSCVSTQIPFRWIKLYDQGINLRLGKGQVGIRGRRLSRAVSMTRIVLSIETNLSCCQGSATI